MSKNILLSITNNNGYGCSCCSYTWNHHSWVEEDKVLTFEEVIQKALKSDPYAEFGDTIEFIYESEGKAIYGYYLYVCRDYYDIYICIGDKKYPFKTKDKHDLTKDELIRKYYSLKESGEI